MKLFLILVFTTFFTFEVYSENPTEEELLKEERELQKKLQEVQERLIKVMRQDEKELAVDEKEVKEATLDLKADEADVQKATDTKTEVIEEAEVKQDEAVIAAQEEDVNEMMANIKEEAIDRDADVVEMKEDQFKFAKDHNVKADIERKKVELADDTKRSDELKSKHESRRKKHKQRHSIIDPWVSQMRMFHPANWFWG